MKSTKELIDKVCLEFSNNEDHLRIEAEGHLKGSPEWVVCLAKADAYRHCRKILLREEER